jgi:hypothetical protein
MVVMKIMKLKQKQSRMHIKAVFKALVDAAIPRTCDPVEKNGDIQSFGALDSNVDEYHEWSLGRALSVNALKIDFTVDLAKPTVKMLDTAARLLIDTIGNHEPVNLDKLRQEGEFSALAPSDRFRAMLLLEQLKINPSSLPVPFWNNTGLVLHVITSLNFFNTFFYYSGWSELGSENIEITGKNKLEYSPVSWKQVGYPGPSKGYHAFRGYLNENFMK